VSSAAHVFENARLAYERTMALERNGEFERALQGYLSLASTGTEYRQEALYAIARLHLQRGERAEARAAFLHYRGEYPDGRFAPACATHLLNLFTEANQSAEALTLAESFLRKWPTDARAWRFRLVLAADRAAHGDCAGALQELPANANSAQALRIRQSCVPRPTSVPRDTEVRPKGSVSLRP
jgi:TolA-binding protein